MNKPLLKDFFREIRKSITRFLSILGMVALGVAFFVGVRSSEPDMTISADAFYDNSDFYDIRVAGTLGVTEEDLAEIRKTEGIKAAVGAYQTEAIAQRGNNEYILVLYSLDDGINKPGLSDGRLPEKPDECLMDKWLADRTDLKLGDTVTLRADAGDDISDSLSYSTFTIVGTCSYPGYLSWDRGTASIGDGSCDAFLVIPPESFAFDVYTSVYATVEGAKELLCYSDEYKDLVKSTADRIEKMADLRCEVRYSDIQNEGNEKISEGEEKIADARKELADAEKQLMDAETELDDARIKIADAEKEIADGKTELEQREADYADGVKKYEDGLKKFNDGKKDYEDGLKKYNDGVKEYEKGLAEYNSGAKKAAKARAELESAEKELAAAKAVIDENRQKLSEGEKETEKKEAELKAGYEAGLIDEITYGYGMLQIEEAKKQAEAARKELDAAKAEYDTAYAGYVSGLKETEAGEAVLASSKKILDDSEKELKKAKLKLDDAEKELKDAEKELADAKTELEDGRVKLDDAHTELADGEKKLADAKEEFQDGEAKLADAKETYERESAEANLKLSDAEADIADAKEKLADVDYPEWYVLDRNANRSFVEYKMDSERIGAIGTLFPVIFFLVAALVSLTTMTRMIEEQRMQIGTMKALGYSKFAIAGKYFFYALFAGALGSALGVFLGAKFLAYEIVGAYGILYINVADIHTPVDAGITALAVIAANGCVLFATLFACYRELMAVPAELMRPPAPKKGKRILLERVGFIWKRMNFSVKSTCRNLFRYKKRLFMTVIGIGGCMGLLMVGYGLRDSIKEIVNNQYRTLWTYDAYLSVDDATEEISALADENPEISDSMYSELIAMDAVKDGITKDANLFIPEKLESFGRFVSLQDRITKEKYTLSDEGAVINEKLASMLSLSRGDIFELKNSDNDSYTLTVADITENYLYNYVYVSPAYYEKVFGKSPEYNQLLLKTKSVLSEETRAGLGRSMLEIDGVKTVNFVKDLEDTVNRMMSSLDDVIWILILAAGLLAFIVLYNLNNINIIERRRELATLKVLGFYNGETAMYVYRENIVLTVLGIGAGVGIGLFLHNLVIKTCEIDMVMFGREIKPMSFFWCILLTFVFAMLVNVFMFYSLKKIDMVESLKSVE